MILSEFGSTGAEEMLVFQRLLLVNGTKPLKLAVWPRAITLQARFPPPVPPPFPPPFPPPPPPPEVLETPAQAIRKKATPTSTEKRKTRFQSERSPADMIGTFSAV